MNGNSYIAIPKKYFEYPNDDASVLINYGGKQLIVTPIEIVKEMTFDDKFNRNQTYTLAYVLWEGMVK